MGLYNDLSEYGKKDFYPFHMPGHKRNIDYLKNPFKLDITEIDGFDNLHHAEGIIKEAQEEAARLYGSKYSYFLVNGSTSGLLSSVFACTKQNGKLLIARNCHKAVYHAAILRELNIVYSYPQIHDQLHINGGINPIQIEEMLISNQDIQAVLITSPTYEGVVSDIKRIADIVHKYDKILIVDEAHGAHFRFSDRLPISALECNSDLVIQSLHKTLPVLTQGAIIHLNSDRIKKEELEKYLSMFQTSSPSYVLMASMQRALESLGDVKNDSFAVYIKRILSLRNEIMKLNNIHLLNYEDMKYYDAYDLDFTKLVFTITDNIIDCKWLEKILREKYLLEIEMSSYSYAIAMTSVSDSEEGFLRLLKALVDIDNYLNMQKKIRIDSIENYSPSSKLKSLVKIAHALNTETVSVKLEESVDRISSEFVYMYPPGIPLIVPGERITDEIIMYIKLCHQKGYNMQGLVDYTFKYIQVMADMRYLI